ncbi:CoA ester lyase [Variovorax rhizosphaerae]|uniref:CoA ester lyase n=1 Tax=Variovorax rhizosphaerae TaxID=1836200 RepID=A0ABU8WR74_9BURK
MRSCVVQKHPSAKQIEDWAWRSILFVPAHRHAYLDKAGRSGADAVQLDLEDSVPTQVKTAARDALAQAVPQLRGHGVGVLVRVNRPLELAVPDIQAAIRAGADAISLTKVASAEHVRLLDELVAVEEQRSGTPVRTRLIAIVETAHAFGQMQAIAEASPRVAALMLGSEDFALDCGAEALADVLLMPKQSMIIAARAAGVQPLGYIGSVADFRDLDAFRTMVQRSRRFGFEGATCVHPSQVPILNEAFGVSVEEASQATRLIQAYQSAAGEGRGALMLDGRMVDLPMFERAKRTLARAVIHASRTASLS